jgi:lambda family phage portal protein
LDGVTIQALGSDGPAVPGNVAGASRWTRWNPFVRDARGDTLPDLLTNRAKSRDLARTAPIAVGAINTNVDRVVGTGLALSSQPHVGVLGWTAEQAAEWKAKTQIEFSLWADSTECDIEETLNFYDQQGLVLRSTLESGDTFTLLPDGSRTPTQPYALRLQIIEADRVGNPFGQLDTALMAAGVQTNRAGAPQSYYVYDMHPGAASAGLFGFGQAALRKGQWVERKGPSGRLRMLHHYRKLRPEMPRGLPYLTPIIDCIKNISRYTEAEISAAVVASFLTLIVQTPTGNAAPIFSGAPTEAGQPAGSPIALGPAAVLGLAPGETAEVVDPSRPNPNFGPFVQSLVTQIGMALGIPSELLLKQFNASYSASKAALLDAWIYFRTVRTWLSRSFCQPVYEMWLTEAVAIGRVSAPGFFADPLMRWAYTRANWHGDSMGSINPKDEVAAYAEAIERGLMSHERAEWELFGTDWNETFATKKTEREQLKKAGMQPAPKAGAAAPAPEPAGPAPAPAPAPASTPLPTESVQ